MRAETGEVRRRTDSLQQQSADLERYTIMLLHFLDDADVIDVEWDPSTGEPRRVVRITLTAQARGQATMEARVIRHGEQEPPEDQREQPRGIER